MLKRLPVTVQGNKDHKSATNDIVAGQGCRPGRVGVVEADYTQNQLYSTRARVFWCKTVVTRMSR